MAEISKDVPLIPAAVENDANPLIAAGIARGVMRLFADLGYAALQEFPLRAKRRADIVALNDASEFVIVEIKSCRADFRADQKWPEYLDFCDRFFFAVAPGFPRDILPGDRFLICSDGLIDGLWDRQLEEFIRTPPADGKNLSPAQRLVEEAVQASGRDNTTALVVEVVAPPS